MIKETATSNKINGVKNLDQKKAATALNDEDIIDSMALPVKVSQEDNSATDKSEHDTLATVNEQKDSVTTPQADLIDLGKKGEKETLSNDLKSDLSAEINPKTEIENNLTTEILSEKAQPLSNDLKSDLSAEINSKSKIDNNSSTHEINSEKSQQLNNDLKSDLSAEVNSKTEIDNNLTTTEILSEKSQQLNNELIMTENQSENDSDKIESDFKTGFRPTEPKLGVLIETNTSDEDADLSDDDDFGDAEPVKVIHSCITALNIFYTLIHLKSRIIISTCVICIPYLQRAE